MPRRYRPPKREISPDIRYNSVLVERFINRMMYGGKKNVARRVMYDAMDIMEARAGNPPLEIFEGAIQNVMPPVEVKPRRVGGATYQIPVEVPRYRQVSLAIRWLLAAARSRGGHDMVDKLAAELLDASEERGAAVRRREETLRMAEANRAFAHLRW
ncbi:MAG: 30S ribosomal protein S7 [Chloroflexi bacterium]|jgi:small subunit ribosomal protein S7|nr:30S ribosomal protein S7 [Chloroflexota bacterium]